MARTTEFGDPATKAAVRAYAKRIRENLRDIESALLENDWTYVEAMANDTIGAASAITTISEANAS
jgi:hypothetical protein